MIDARTKLVLADNRLGGVRGVALRRGSYVGAWKDRFGVRDHVRVEHVRWNLVARSAGRLNPIGVRRGIAARVAQKGRIGEARGTARIRHNAVRVKDLTPKRHASNGRQIATELRRRR